MLKLNKPSFVTSTTPRWSSSLPKASNIHIGTFPGTIRHFNGKGGGFVATPTLGIENLIYFRTKDIKDRKLRIGESVNFTLSVKDAGRKALNIRRPTEKNISTPTTKQITPKTTQTNTKSS